MNNSERSSVTILHHMRWAAAFAVAISHYRQNLLFEPANGHSSHLLAKVVFSLSSYGRTGVMVFFVLSGFLVGGKTIKLLHTPDLAHEWPRFLLDRFSRIFIVLWPAILLSLIIFLFLRHFTPNAPFMEHARWGWSLRAPLNNDAPAYIWVESSVLLNSFGLPTLNIDAPLWSLAYEWFYYMAALAFVLLFRREFTAKAILLIAYAVGLLGLSLYFNREVVELGAVWVMGVGAKLAFDRKWLTAPWLKWVSIAAVLSMILLVPLHGSSPDLPLGATIAFMIAHRDWATWRHGAIWGEKLASFSYSLYVTHYPLTILALGVFYRLGYVQTGFPLSIKTLCIMAPLLAVAIGFAWLFSLVTEVQTPRLRNALLAQPQFWRSRSALKPAASRSQSEP